MNIQNEEYEIAIVISFPVPEAHTRKELVCHCLKFKSLWIRSVLALKEICRCKVEVFNQLFQAFP